MAELTTEQVFDGEQNEVFRALGLYESYPDYIPAVNAVQLLEPTMKASKVRVRYDIKLVKAFYYTLHMFEEAPTRLSWQLDDSNLFKRNTGSWHLEPLEPHRTKAVYKLDVAFSGFVPGRIVDQVTKANLPGMMAGFQKLIDAKKQS